MTTRFSTRRRWLIGSSIVLVPLTVLILRLPHLADQRIASLLADYGVTTYQRGAARAGLTAVVVDRLFLQGASGSMEYALTLRGSRAEYHWRTLIHGQLTAVSIPKLDLELVMAAADEEEVSQPLDLDKLHTILANIELPLDVLTIGRLHVALTRPDGKKLAMAGHGISFSRMDKALTGELTLLTPDHPLLENMEAAVTLLPGSLPWLPDLSVSLNMEGQRLFNSQLKLQQAEAPKSLSLSVSGHLQQDNILPLLGDGGKSLIDLIPGDNGDNQPEINAEMHFAGDISLPPRLDTSQSAWWQHLPFNGNLTARLGIRGVKVEGFAPDAFVGKIIARGSLDKLTIRLAGLPVLTGEFDADTLGEFADAIPWAGSQPVEVTLSAAVPIDAAWQESLPLMLGVTDLQVKAAVGRSPSIAKASFTLESFKLNQQGMRGSFQFETDLPYGKRQLPPLALSGEIHQQGKKFEGSGLLSIPGWQVDGRWHYAPEGAPQGQIKATLRQQDLAMLGNKLRAFDFLPEPLSLASGKVTLDVLINLSALGAQTSKPPEMTFGVDATHLSGLYNSMAFENVSLSGQVKRDSQWQSVKPLVVHVDSLSAGVPITNAMLQARLEKSPDLFHSSWLIDQLQGELFGGNLKLSHPAPVSLPFTGNKLEIQFTNLDLAKILALYREQGVSGRGQLNGSLPVILETDGVRIARGTLASNIPGQIAYRPGDGGDAVVGSHQQLATTLRLLEDFHYDSLRVTTDFSPSGLMALKLQLSGRNPAEFDGRLVNFNITVEENLYDLLKVLQLTDELTKSLEKQLDKHTRQRK